MALYFKAWLIAGTNTNMVYLGIPVVYRSACKSTCVLYPNLRCFYRISTDDLVLISFCSLPLHSLTFLYSCLWMTTACARLCPLTLAWPGAWRFSTNSRSAYVLSCVCPSPVILSFSGRCAYAFVLRVFPSFISFHRAQSNQGLWEDSV